MSIIDKIESITASRNTIRTKMLDVGQATRTDKLATLASNLSIPNTSDATAAASDIAQGKTAYVQGEKITGTSTKDADTSDATATASDILTGKTAYSNGVKLTGTATAGIDTSDATATASDILEGVTAYSKGVKLTGTMKLATYADIDEILTPPVTIKSFASATDKEITAMLKALRAGNIDYQDLVDAGWTVGAERPVHLSAMTADGVGESHVAQDKTWVILHGKDFFDLVDGGKNLFVVGLKDLIEESGYINSTAINTGGWNSCARRTWCNNVFKNAIPSEELNWFKQFNVKTSNGNQSTSVTTSTDLFSLPSRAEVFGGSNTSYTPDAEGTTILSYYSDTSNRKKKKKSGSAVTYWLRSPGVSNTTTFCIVTYNGVIGNYSANDTNGLSPYGCF